MKPGWERIKRIIPAVLVVCLTMLLLAGSFCGCFAAVAPGQEHDSPDQIILTWTGDPATTQSVTWLMPGDAPARLQYLQAEEFNGDFTGVPVIEAEGSEFDSANYRYSVTLSELVPDTQYFYRVGRGETWSDTLSFTTAAETEEFSFLYLGDLQSGYAEWGSMLDSVFQDYPEIKFSLMGGDITDNGNDKTEWSQFLDAASGVFSRIPLMPTLGNHDSGMYFKFFTLPDNGPDGLQQEFYSFDYGNAHFVVLNSNYNTSEAARQWLREDLQGTAKSWKFALFHHPAYPAFEDYKTIDESICENWVPILEQYGVDMVFVGHQHQYMRTYPIFQGAVQTDPGAYGIVYVMGNAGSKTYSGGNGYSYIAAEQTGSNFQVISIDGDVLTMTAKKAGGELIESYTIDKSLKTPPALTADNDGNEVGNDIDIKFADDAAWRAAITGVNVNGSSIDSRYSVDAGVISIDAGVFSSAGDYEISVAAGGYKNAVVTQTIVNLIPLQIPPLMIPDTTNNSVNKSVYKETGVKIDIRFADDSSWRTAITGIFVNDTELSSDRFTLSKGKIRIEASAFTAAGDYEITVQAGGYEDATVIQTILSKNNKRDTPEPPAAPVLIADNSANNLGKRVDIKFTDNTDWRTAITGIFVNDTELSSDQYTLSKGKIRIEASAFTAAGDYEITVRAGGYEDATVAQTISSKKKEEQVAEMEKSAGGHPVIIFKGQQRILW